MAKNNDEREELEVDADDQELRVYELGFHLDGDLPTEEVKKRYQALRDVVAGAGSIVAEGEPVKVPLAYTISRSEQGGRRDFNAAYFCWIAYEAEGPGHASVVEAAKGASDIIRFIDIKTTKEAAQHSAEIAEIYARAAEPAGETVEEEVVRDEELDAALKEAGVA